MPKRKTPIAELTEAERAAVAGLITDKQIVSRPSACRGYKQSMEILTAENFNYASAAVAVIAAVHWFRSAWLRFPSSASATIAALGTATHINLTELNTALRRWRSARS